MLKGISQEKPKSTLTNHAGDILAPVNEQLPVESRVHSILYSAVDSGSLKLRLLFIRFCITCYALYLPYHHKWAGSKRCHINHMKVVGKSFRDQQLIGLDIPTNSMNYTMN